MPLQFKEWFVAERAKALAMILLTRREDLDVKETKGDNGLDYIVGIRAQEGGPRQFGVLLRATMSPVMSEQANAQLEPTMGGMKALGPFGFPVSVFFFTVKDEKGYYTWGHEPIVVDGQAKLRARSEADCRKLDDAALEEIVALVKEWYDAFFAAVML